MNLCEKNAVSANVHSHSVIFKKTMFYRRSKNFLSYKENCTDLERFI